MKYQIMGMKNPIGVPFKTRAAAEQYLKMLQAKPDTTARQYALKFTIKEVK